MRDKPLILVVDDEKNFQEIVCAKLTAAGFECAMAGNEAEAVRQAEALMPDLILMDIFMPGGLGSDAALAIKENDKTKDVKIAFLTSLKDPWPGLSGDKKSVVEEMGMQDYLDKTDDLEKLVEKVKEILARV